MRRQSWVSGLGPKPKLKRLYKREYKRPVILNGVRYEGVREAAKVYGTYPMSVIYWLRRGQAQYVRERGYVRLDG